jgi:hypothetical protein
MHTRTRIAQFVAALATCGAALAQPEISIVERQQVSMPGTNSHRLALTLVQLEGSGWTRERALGALREAAAILAQCDIGIVSVEWVSLSAPARYLDFSTPAARELARLHPVSRPAIYLVRDTRSHPAFDAETIGRGNSRTRPELAYTVWMTAATRDPGVALAHELAHVLMDSGEHSDEPGNLMRDETSTANTALSATQCTRLRETARANGLLQR